MEKSRDTLKENKKVELEHQYDQKISVLIQYSIIFHITQGCIFSSHNFSVIRYLSQTLKPPTTVTDKKKNQDKTLMSMNQPGQQHPCKYFMSTYRFPPLTNIKWS